MDVDETEDARNGGGATLQSKETCGGRTADDPIVFDDSDEPARLDGDIEDNADQPARDDYDKEDNEDVTEGNKEENGDDDDDDEDEDEEDEDKDDNEEDDDESDFPDIVKERNQRLSELEADEEEKKTSPLRLLKPAQSRNFTWSISEIEALIRGVKEFDGDIVELLKQRGDKFQADKNPKTTSWKWNGLKKVGQIPKEFLVKHVYCTTTKRPHSSASNGSSEGRAPTERKKARLSTGATNIPPMRVISSKTAVTTDHRFQPVQITSVLNPKTSTVYDFRFTVGESAITGGGGGAFVELLRVRELLKGTIPTGTTAVALYSLLSTPSSLR